LSRQATVKLQSGSDGKTMKAQGFIVPAQNLNHLLQPALVEELKNSMSNSVINM
jgi:hypothetical protein